MGLIFKDGELLFAASGELAMHTDCCCFVCDDFTTCFGEPTGIDYTQWEGTAAVSGVTDAGCPDCEDVNVTFDAITPQISSLPGRTCECSITWGNSLVGGNTFEVCTGAGVSGEVSAEIDICYFDGDWEVNASLVMRATDAFNNVVQSCGTTFTGQDAVDVINELCNSGTVAIVITGESVEVNGSPDDIETWRLCTCVGATLTFSLAAV